MSILKTYSIANEISVGDVEPDRLQVEIKESDYIIDYRGFYIEGDDINVLGYTFSIGTSSGSTFSYESALDTLIFNHDGVTEYGKYRVLLDVEDNGKDFKSINYKSELKSGVSYTPIFYFHYEGEFAGILEKTEYYKNYIDKDNKGTLILIVEEDYVIDNEDTTINYSARPVLSRTKTWKWVKDDGTIDETNVKVKPKLYDTRKKRHVESVARRENIVQQLIDHVGLAGVLSGVFSDSSDAYDELTTLQEFHSNSFSGWVASGRGSLISVIETDTETTWLDSIIPDTPTTQAMCGWMIGLKFRDYIQEKLAGNIK